MNIGKVVFFVKAIVKSEPVLTESFGIRKVETTMAFVVVGYLGCRRRSWLTVVKET